ncbi:helix-turn-helix transcriptional regulator [Anaerospora hongkongensis]|jgi:transcriptional regulator with XRE-family HTH domain|uniref:helix-turn-helix domain-containing protein n=1 Tax=Anaerospora hongkongensis TaxID=244830 RepID=UPI0028A2207E|nr:helix-turn-helix transcriptional regulator [Anaerospora hongkongensis]
MHIDYHAIGQRIKKARKQKGFTQEKLGENLDVSTVYISQIENGKTKINLEMLIRIAAVLNTNPGFFITGVAYQTQDYMKYEMSKLLHHCPPERRQLIFDVAKVIANHK